MNAAGCLKALGLAGQIILENGGETYRAEDTVERMARTLGLKDADVFAVPSGLFISFTDEDGERRTSVTRIHLRGTHLARVDRVNHLSRRLAMGTLTPDELLIKLQEAEKIGDHLPMWYNPLYAFLCAVSFAAMFGGGLVEMLLAGVCAAVTQLVPLVLRGHDAGGMGTTLIGGIICVVIPLFFQAATGLGVTDIIVAGAIMPLVPGLSMTNAVRDILRGDMVSGVAHCARALMVAVMVAGGAVVGTRAFDMLGLFSNSAAAAVQHPFWIGLIISFVSSAAAGLFFGVLLHAPLHSLPVSGLIAGLGYVSYWVAMQYGLAETSAMFIGALIASVGAQIAARHLKMIATIFITIAILPLVPGLGLYRAMRALAQSQLELGGSIASHTMALIVMIALGVGLGSAVRWLGGAERKGGGKE